MQRSMRRLATLLAVAVLTLGSASDAYAAGSYQSSTNCGVTYKFVHIWSRAGVYVEHSWKFGGYQTFHNPYREYRESATSYSSTWWVVDWNDRKDSLGAYCTT